MKNIVIVLLAVVSVLGINCSYILKDEVEESQGPEKVTLYEPQIIYPTAAVISWTRAESKKFVGYKVFYDTLKDVSLAGIIGGSVSFKDSTTFLLKGLWRSTTYHVKVFVNDGSALSGSNEISFITPTCTCGVYTGERQDGMVSIPAGCYSGKDGSIGFINHDFFMDTTEVTEASWYEVMHDSVVTSLKPKTEVSWFQATLYCNKKSKKKSFDTCYSYSSIIYDTVINKISNIKDLECDFTKNGFRLPTEDEWEYSYRAGLWEEYYWGKDGNTLNEYPWTTSYPKTLEDTLEICEYAWWEYNNRDTLDWHSGLKDVATRKPNGWHLYDMAGNVQEFVWDILADERPVSRIDYTGPLFGPQSGIGRIIRGGRFNLANLLLTAWFRHRQLEPSLDYKKDVGFRTVRTVVQ